MQYVLVKIKDRKPKYYSYLLVQEGVENLWPWQRPLQRLVVSYQRTTLGWDFRPLFLPFCSWFYVHLQSAKNKVVEVQATPNNTSSKVGSNSEKLDIEPPISEHRKSPISEHRQSSAGEQCPDILDIAGMDYSPAKRKPPIHNWMLV